MSEFTDSLGGTQITNLDTSNTTKSTMLVYIVACVNEDMYVSVDSCYTDYGKANDRAEELMSEDDIEWEVLSCNLDI